MSEVRQVARFERCGPDQLTDAGLDTVGAPEDEDRAFDARCLLTCDRLQLLQDRIEPIPEICDNVICLRSCRG